jgi:hypothetical protein
MDKHQLNDLVFNTSDCPEDSMLLQYAKNELSPQLMRMVELHLPDCEICSDTVEGLQRMNSQLIDETIDAINKQIDKRVAIKEDNKKNLFAQWYLVAAALLIIALTGFIYRYYFEKVTENSVADVMQTEKVNESLIMDSSSVKSEEIKENSTIKNIAKNESSEIENTQPKQSNKPTAIRRNGRLEETTTGAAEQNSTEVLDIASPKIVGAISNDAETSNKEIADEAIKAVPAAGSSANYTSPPATYNSPALSPIISNATNFTLATAESVEKKKAKQSDKDISANDRALKFTDSKNEKIVVITDEKKCKLNYEKACKLALESNISLAETEFKKLIQTNCVQWNEMAKIDLALLYIKLSKKNEAIVLLKEAKNSVIKEVTNRATIELEKANK